MQNLLPKVKTPIQRINPAIVLFYGMPKVGKTKLLAELDDCLTLATEDGIEMYEALYLRITSISGATVLHTEGPLKGTIKSTSVNNFLSLMNEEAARQKAANEPLRFPYKYIAVDTLDEFEAMCEVSATAKYKGTTIGKSFKEDSVLMLPNGGGYYHLRNEVIEQIDRLKKYCKHLILISHVRDKVLDKGGVSVEFRDISLTGKLGQIVAAKCDVIGYLYREPGKPLMVSFETYENSTMGARFARLAGKKFEFAWDKIFIAEDVNEQPVQVKENDKTVVNS